MLLEIVELNDLGRKLKTFCKKARGINQAEVVKKTGYSPQHISQLFNGKSIETSEIAKIAKALGVKVVFIIAQDEEDIKRLLKAQQ